MTSEVTKDKLNKVLIWNHTWEPLQKVVEEGIEVGKVATLSQAGKMGRIFAWRSFMKAFPQYQELHDWMSNSSFQKTYGAAQYPDKPLTQFGYDVLIGLYDMHCIPTDKGIDTDF